MPTVVAEHLRPCRWVLSPCLLEMITVLLESFEGSGAGAFKKVEAASNVDAGGASDNEPEGKAWPDTHAARQGEAELVYGHCRGEAVFRRW